MKKKTTFITSLLLVLILLFSTATVAYARTVYYASSGMQSGYCENASTTSVCRFDNLPNGVMHISYFMESNKTMEIRFYRNASLSGGYNKATLVNNNSGAATTVSLPNSGTYYVIICTTNGSTAEFYYAYDLYKD